MAAAQYFEQVQKIYIAFYQRPADPAGLKYWAERIDVAGGDIGQVIDAFATSAEAQALYGDINATTIGTVIDDLYMALFNKAPDAAGKQFYVDGFTAGTFTAGTIALNVLNGASGDDAVAVLNKVQVANEFTQQVDGRALTNPYFGTGTSFNVTYAGDADAVAARTILKAVQGQPSTVINPSQVTEVLKTQIADATDLIMGQTGGQTFTLTANADAPGATSPAVNTQGTSGNDIYNGVIDAQTTSNTTLQVLDNIDGAGGIDTLNIISNGNAANTVTPLFLKNVEKIVVKDIDATAITTVDLVNATGVTDVINDGSVADVVLNNIGTAAVSAKNLATAGLDTTFTRGAAPVTAALTVNLENLGKAAVVGAAPVQTGVIASNDGNNDATSVTVNATGYVNVTSANLTGTSTATTHTAETVTINAAGTTIFGAAGTTEDITGFNTAKLGKIVVTGAGAVSLNTLAGAVKTVDASANTGGVTLDAGVYTGTEATGVAANGLNITGGSGNDNITLNAVATAVVAAGAGNDTVNVATGLAAGAKIDGGAGEADKVVMTGAQAASLDDQNAVGTALRATLTGFEQIGISGAFDLANNFNIAQAGGYNYLALNGDVTGATAAAVTGFTTGATVEFRNAGNQTTALNIGVTDAALTSTDSVTLKLNADLASGSNFTVRAGVAGVNIVNVVANDRVNSTMDDNLPVGSADNGPDEGYTLVLGDGTTTSANVTNVNISGSSLVNYTVQAATNALKLIDASASTGNAVLDATAFTGTERVEIKGAQGTNTIIGSATAFGDKITGGAKADSITGAAGADDMTGNGGRDAFLFAASGDSGTNAATVDQITDFGLVTAAATAAEVTAMNNIANFQATATAKGGAEADLLSFTTTATLGAAAAATDVVVTLEALEAGDQFAGKTITVAESAKGLLTLGGADAAMVDTLAEWVAIANQAAGTAGNVVQFAFGGNTYVFQQVTPTGTADDTLIELTGVTGATGITLIGSAVAAEAGNIFVI